MTNVVNSSVKRLILIFIILLYSCPGNITKPDEAPIFLNGIPTAETTITKIGETHTVRGTAENPDGDSFQYKTLKDGVKVNDTNEYTFTIDKKGITKIDVVAYNALSDTLTRNFSSENQVPVASNANLSPLEVYVGDTLWVNYDYYDLEGDEEGSTTINYYLNDQQISGTGNMILTNNLQPNDKIKAKITPKDYEGMQGQEVTTNEITMLQYPYRTISGTIIEHWSQTPDENVLVKTSIEEILTNANGEYSLLASIEREDVLVLKEGRLESGYILMPGTNDETKNHEISDDTQENGIDRWLLKNYVLRKGKDENGYGRSDIPPEGTYAALTEESVPDTVWIIGHVEGPMTWTASFQNLDQINLLGKKINETADEMTNGLYNINKTTILIADSNYQGANFDYPNMKAVSNETFPGNYPEQYKNYFFIAASETDYGWNGSFYEDDNVTIDGHVIILGNWLALEDLAHVFDSEFCSSIMSRLQTPRDYNSLFSENGNSIQPQDQRITTWNINRGPGYLYPDFPANFKAEYVEEHNDN